MNISPMNLRKTKYSGWVASTAIQLKDELYIKIQTSKGNNGCLDTRVSSETHLPDGGISFTIGGNDFSTVILREYPKRVTAKIVEAQHNLVDVDSIFFQAKQFYDLV
jgi:hypothetical protein